METQLRELIGVELRRRHAVGLMESKIKPVHIANALMREEHGVVGRMADLRHLMTATAAKETPERQEDAARRLIERSRERWGRLADEPNLKKSVLMTKVLPLLRTILGTDGAAFGATPEMSSFSSPSALTVTRDPSDDHAGALIHRMWSGNVPEERLPILDLLHRLTDPEQDAAHLDDLTAVLAPLAENLANYNPPAFLGQDLANRPFTEIDHALRAAAADLFRYEEALRPNPIATLERIVVLASVSLFTFAASRAHVWAGLPRRPLLLDATGGTRHMAISSASEQTVKRLLDDGRRYMALVLTQMLDGQDPDWPDRPAETLAALFDAHLKKAKVSSLKNVAEIVEELREEGTDIREVFPDRLMDIIDNASRGLDGYLRLLGIRAGLLYPQQKNPIKRLIPSDRTLEVLVASTIDVTQRPMEYRDFLDRFYERWHIVTGGRLQDAFILSDAGITVPTADLSENADRLLSRLEMLGLARKLADSVAVVGMMEGEHARH
jgi:hypothetical protein